MIGLLLGKWPWLAVGAVLGVIALGGPIYLYGAHRGAVAERAAIEGEIAKRTAELLQERAKDNDELRDLDARALCIELLPDGVPESACD